MIWFQIPIPLPANTKCPQKPTGSLGVENGLCHRQIGCIHIHGSGNQLATSPKVAKPSEECLDACAHRRKWPVKQWRPETLSNREDGERDTDKTKKHESSDEIRVGRPGSPVGASKGPLHPGPKAPACLILSLADEQRLFLQSLADAIKEEE